MKVTAILQRGDNEPVEQVWAGKAFPTNEVGVMLSVAQLLQHAKDESPFAPRILEIRIEL